MGAKLQQLNVLREIQRGLTTTCVVEVGCPPNQPVGRCFRSTPSRTDKKYVSEDYPLMRAPKQVCFTLVESISCLLNYVYTECVYLENRATNTNHRLCNIKSHPLLSPSTRLNRESGAEVAYDLGSPSEAVWGRTDSRHKLRRLRQ